MKQLTIAVPSYNVGAYLERGLESYADPSLARDLEVLIVDDGSTDDTASIARRFTKRYPDVFRLISKENGGHGSAVNTGLAAARGRYFRVVDGDDWVDTRGLGRELELLASIHSDIVVDWRRDVHMVSGATEPRPLQTGLRRGVELPFDEVALEVARDSTISIHTLMGRTDFLRGCGIHLLERCFYVDTQFVIEATARARTVTFLDIEVYQYLVGNAAQSVAASSFVARFGDHDRVVREVLAFVEDRISSGALTDEREAYLRLRARLLVNTHYNVMLVYDPNGVRGRTRARAFRSWLGRSHRWLRRESDGRYLVALAAGLVGLDAEAMDRIHGRMGHEADA